MKKLFVLILTGLFLPVFCFAVINYERTPSGDRITSPVNIEWSWTTTSEICSTCDGDETYQIIIDSDPLANLCGLAYPIATNSGSESFNAPVGMDSYGVWITFGNRTDYNCGDMSQEEYWFEEYTDETPVFTIISSVFTMPENAIGSTTETIADLFDSIGAFVWLIIGIPLSFVVIKRIMLIIPK